MGYINPTGYGTGSTANIATDLQPMRIILWNLAQSRVIQGRLLGLVALHTMITSIALFYKLKWPAGKICCDNLVALCQLGQCRQRVCTGIKHAHLHQAIQTIRLRTKMKTIYEYVRAHQDRILPWKRLFLEQQLNVICDELANGAVEWAIMEVESHSGPKFLPFESVAVVLNGIKLTTDVGSEVRYRLGKEGVKWLYTKPCNVVQGTNRGGLGWLLKLLRVTKQQWYCH